MGVLAGALGILSLALWAAIVASLGAVLRLVIALRRSGVERRQEVAELERRMRVPIDDVTDVDPTEIGVDAAPPQTLLPGDALPQYLPREVDEALDDAVAAALCGTGPWLVIAVGSSKVGKSRALFEALRRRGEAGGLDFVAPASGASVKSLVVPGQQVELSRPASVLWLDDLEPFVNEGVTMQVLREWHEQNPNSFVAATYGGKGSDIVAGSGSGALATIADEILQHGREITLSSTARNEIEPLRAATSAGVMRSVERHGLAAYLVAGPKLERKLTTGIHSTGEAKCPEGLAVVRAAVDWARCGRTDPISEKTLYALWPDYLSADCRPSQEAFEQGLEWALKAVAGTVALLERVAGYRAYDYVIRIVNQDPDGGPPRDSVWRQAVADASDAQALAVGISAFEQEQYEIAAQAFAIARRSEEELAAAMAGVNHGVTLGRLDRHEEAIAVFDEMAEHFGDASRATLREGAAFALVSKGFSLGRLGRHEEGILVYEQVVARFGDSAEDGLRTQVAKALLNKGVVLAMQDRDEEAINAYETVVERFGADLDDETLIRVIKALVNKGGLLLKLGRPREALGVYEEVIDRLDGAAGPDLEGIAAAALGNAAITLSRLDESERALQLSDEVLGRHRESKLPALQMPIAQALFSRGHSLMVLDRSDEGVAAFDELVERFGGAQDEDLREFAVMALSRKASLFMRRGRPEEEIQTYDEVIALAGDAEKPGIKGCLAESLLLKALTLGELGRLDEERETYDEIVTRFGDWSEPSTVNATATALLNKSAGLVKQKRFQEALPIYEEVVDRCEEAGDADLSSLIAMALFNKASTLFSLDRAEEATPVLGAIIERYGDTETPRLREVVADARDALDRIRSTD